MSYYYIKNISSVTGNCLSQDSIKLLHKNNFFSQLDSKISTKLSLKELKDKIDTRLKKRMSVLSLGIYYVMENGPGKFIKDNDDLFFFTGFGEIDTTKKIIDEIILNNRSLVSPTLFHNSVHNTAMSYYTIISKKNNYALTVTDGLDTDLSFINMLLLLSTNADKFTIAVGDEESEFYNLDKTVSYQVPSFFCAYNIFKNESMGFKFLGKSNVIQDISDYNYIISDKITFKELKSNYSKKSILSEYSLLKDNPTSISFRLALPFILKLNNSLVIHKHENFYYLFRIDL